ncbi:hypothetical protein WMF27_00810 [Sorangium sp. So ce281]|uniref:hypothetical protein n=1 Tax=unclassified Sorangium TaxID=2621164 RepID=UPI003F5D7B67
MESLFRLTVPRMSLASTGPGASGKGLPKWSMTSGTIITKIEAEPDRRPVLSTIQPLASRMLLDGEESYAAKMAIMAAARSAYGTTKDHLNDTSPPGRRAVPGTESLERHLFQLGKINFEAAPSRMFRPRRAAWTQLSGMPGPCLTVFNEPL